MSFGMHGLGVPLRAVIGESDSASRALIADVLGEHSDVEVVATCRTGKDVVRAIESLRPDLVFLDVQMPQMSAFEIMAAVQPARMPPAVFIATKHDFAVRAFDVQALDYILKPLRRQRVEQALSRAREHVGRVRFLALAGRLLDQAPHEEERDTLAERLMVRSGTRLIFIDAADVDWIEADGNYVRLHVGAKSYRMRKTMSEMEHALGPQQFVRVHRRILIRVARVRELRLKPGGRYDAVLDNGVSIPVSRTYRVPLAKRLGRS